MSLTIFNVLTSLISISGILIFSLMIVDLVLIRRISTHVQDITRLWKNQPIVSIYASSSYQEEMCTSGYEALPFSGVALPGIPQASCGCTANPYGYSSSIEPCPSQGQQSGYCSTLNVFDSSKGLSWRGSTLCVKRAGRPAATYKGHYSGRPHPNKHGKCPHGYRKCGEGKNQDEGAICFPDNAECPITNIMVLSSAVSPPSNEGWEPAGTFWNDNHTLYFRREHVNELPIMNVTVALTEFAGEQNIRGQCFRGKIQSPGRIDASKTSLWTYLATLPPHCETTDARYEVADQLSLEDAYLRSGQVMEPACAGFQLYALDDARYDRTSDPDYLNSGVKCGSDRYICVRDPYQHTDCTVGDKICDGVINQNICGEYAHAVRSAFSDSTVTLGLYYVREIEWSDQCDVSKKEIFNYRKVPKTVFFKLLWCVLLFLAVATPVSLGPSPAESPEEGTTERVRREPQSAPTVGCYVVFILTPLLVTLCVAMLEISEMNDIYVAMENGECTDDFTAEIILSRLYPIPVVYWVSWILLSLIVLVSVVVTLALRSRELGAQSLEAATVVPAVIVEEELDMVPTSARVTVEDMEVGFTETARTDEGSAETIGEVVDAKQVDVDEFVGESLFTSERTSESTTGEYNALPTQEV